MKNKDLVIAPNLAGITDSDVLPPEVMRQLEDKIPEWLKEMEADGTAVLRWNLEHLMIIEQILQDKFGLSENQLADLEKDIKEILPHVAQFKAEEPRLLKREDYYVIKQMIERNKQLYKSERSGISLPSKAETKALGKGKK